MKDLELLPLSERMGRIIWRVLGIQPVLMGDTEKMPLASAKVQFDLSNSHLLEPILELLGKHQLIPSRGPHAIM